MLPSVRAAILSRDSTTRDAVGGQLINNSISLHHHLHYGIRIPVLALVQVLLIAIVFNCIVKISMHTSANISTSILKFVD